MMKSLCPLQDCTCRSLPFPGRLLFRARWTRWMGVSSGLASTLSKLALLPCSTRAGRLGPVSASWNFLTYLKRALREKKKFKWRYSRAQEDCLTQSTCERLNTVHSRQRKVNEWKRNHNKLFCFWSSVTGEQWIIFEASYTFNFESTAAKVKRWREKESLWVWTWDLVLHHQHLYT